MDGFTTENERDIKMPIHISVINSLEQRLSKKNTCYTEVTRALQNLLLIFNTSFQFYKSRVQKSKVQFSSIVQSFCVSSIWLPNSIELNSWIEFDLVRLSSIEIQFNWVSIGYAGYSKTRNFLVIT